MFNKWRRDFVEDAPMSTDEFDPRDTPGDPDRMTQREAVHLIKSRANV